MAIAILQHSVRRPAGYILVTDPDGAGFEAETLMCCHCQSHWVVHPGSGIRRGYCYNCQAVTCGKPKCDPCAPWEKQMEEMEARQRLLDAAAWRG